MPDFLTVKQTAKVMQLSTDHVYDLAARGRMPSVKISTKCIRIPRIALQKWLEGGENQSALVANE
jgi:excisionase family DNA binding protein